MSAMAAGSVKTTWKYGTGKSSASRSASQRRAVAPWHFGQCRLRQELYAISVWPHAAFSQRATCPPSAAVTALDRTHHLQLVEADVPAMGLPPSRAVIAEDVRDLQSWLSHGR